MAHGNPAPLGPLHQVPCGFTARCVSPHRAAITVGLQCLLPAAAPPLARWPGPESPAQAPHRGACAVPPGQTAVLHLVSALPHCAPIAAMRALVWWIAACGATQRSDQRCLPVQRVQPKCLLLQARGMAVGHPDGGGARSAPCAPGYHRTAGIAKHFAAAGPENRPRPQTSLQRRGLARSADQGPSWQAGNGLAGISRAGAPNSGR